MKKCYYLAEWVPRGCYHVFNSAVHRNKFVRDKEDYEFFVGLLRDRVTGFAEVFAYAIIPNHYHLAIRLYSETRLRDEILAKPERFRTVKEGKWLTGEIPYRQLIGDYWATLFTMYANYYNPKVGRRGTLLNRTLRRIRVRRDLVSRRLIMYIHTNEVKHGSLLTYTRSGVRTSFGYYTLERDDHWLARDIVLERFGGLGAFYIRHEQYVRKYGAQISKFDELMYFDPQGELEEEAPYVEFLEDEARPH